MSRLACLFVLLVGCASYALEPLAPSGESTKQIQVGGYGLVTIGMIGRELVRVDGERYTTFATLPDGFDYMVDPEVPEDAPGDFYVVGSRSEGRMITTATWTFWWDRASEKFVSRAPTITQSPYTCDVCLDG